MQRSLFSTLIVAGALSVTSIALANDLDVPVLEEGGDGDTANCSSSMVSGLKANGDGFLAVRSGPGSRYRKIDELHDGEIVIVFDGHGKWLGVVYRTPNVPCHSTKTHPLTYEKRGWVHTKWLIPFAG
ncbi:MAG: SH3 domain-containing protein [Methylocella sp.]